MRGWKSFRQTVSGVVTALTVCGAVVAAEPVSAPMLSAEFLEFLADWENEQGAWQDPTEYEDPRWQALDEKAGQNDE
jgi:hypothetical protein